MKGHSETMAPTLRYMHSLEAFNPPPIEAVKEDPTRISPQSVCLEDYPVGSLLPWQPRHKTQTYPRGTTKRKDGAEVPHVWSHAVFLGVFPRALITPRLDSLTHPASTDRDETERQQIRLNLTGDTGIACLIVDDEGHVFPGSAVLSECAWSLGRVAQFAERTPAELRADVPLWAEGFTFDSTGFSNAVGAGVGLDRRPPPPCESDGSGEATVCKIPPADWRAVQWWLRLARDFANSDRALGGGPGNGQVIRIYSRQIPADETRRATFLNSFLVDDLRHIIAKANRGDIGVALREYLTENEGIDFGRRVDVRRSLETVASAIDPGVTPLGHWPSPSDQLLALSQQLAVNQAVSCLDGAGLFSVNGPPGTGKTTLLRDVIAHVIVSRAQALYEFKKPWDAFTGDAIQWVQRNGDVSTVYPWQPALCGFEMVVASNNNAAVENVTVELPRQDAIGREWRDMARELDYYRECANALLGGIRGTNEEMSDPTSGFGSWGLIAARLGNAKNRRDFVNGVWFDESTHENSSRPPQRTEQRLAEANLRVYLSRLAREDKLASAARQTQPMEGWENARKQFSDALGQAKDMQSQRARAHHLMIEIRRLDQEIWGLPAALARAEADVRSSQQSLDAAQGRMRQADEDRDRCQRSVETHRSLRPNWLKTLFTRGAQRREWRVRDGQLAEAAAQAQQASRVAHDDADRIQADHQEACLVWQVTADHLAKKRREADDLHGEFAALWQHCGRHAMTDRWWNEDTEAEATRQLATPWADQEWNAARSRVLLAALHLHKAFVQAVPGRMRAGLSAAIDLVARPMSTSLDSESLMHIWRYLFFMVPVVSTTFAALPRLFGNLGRESIGWLLVDEAGQAAPQDVVGGLWRSRRAILVGDPLQLEPVVTLPDSTQAWLQRAHGTTPTWLPGKLSAQAVADRVSRFGTSLVQGESPLWVSAPLRVHRRCGEPMFGLVNDLVYGGLMIQGAADRGDPPGWSRVPRSVWIDVAGPGEGHVRQVECDQLRLCVRDLLGNGVTADNIFVLSPFRQVADDLEDHLPSRAEIRHGTVHTSQGREADIVIFVLGGDPAHPGAQQWAAEKPNLFNVAVSRAKRRLYVIGDRRQWRDLPYFRDLATRLPVVTGWRDIA